MAENLKEDQGDERETGKKLHAEEFMVDVWAGGIVELEDINTGGATEVTTYDGFEARMKARVDADDEQTEDKEIYKLWAPKPTDDARFIKHEKNGSFSVVDPDPTRIILPTARNPEFQFYTYSGIRRPGSKEEEKIFVYTGAGHTQVSGGYYMLLEDLTKRLDCSTLSFVYKDDLKKINEWKADTDKPVDKDGVSTIDSTHLPFPLWKDNGDPVNDRKPFSELIIGIDLATHMDQENVDEILATKPEEQSIDILKQFVHYANLAHAASLAPKAPYSVLTRFWDLPKEYQFQNDKVYIRLANNVTLAKVNEKLKEYRNLHFKPTLEAPDSNIDTHPDYTKLGAHPLGLYEIFVKTTLSIYIKEAQGEDREVPDTIKEKLQEFAAKIGDKTHTEPIESRVSKLKVLNALSHHRENYDSQKAVMKDVSATDIAKVLWPEGNKGDKIHTGMAEWLHRSAWSFGGLENEPSSSQTQKNLIFGTCQCNTAMIRHEEVIKRWAGRLGDDGDIELTTRLIPVGDDGYGWLGKELQYEYFASNAPGIKVKEIFYPFSCKVPTRLEVILDNIVEKLTYA